MPSASSLLLRAVRTDPLAYTRMDALMFARGFSAAFVELLAEAKKCFSAIVRQDVRSASFSSVVEPLLEMGVTLDTLWAMLDNFHSTHGSAKTKELMETHQPKLVAFQNACGMHEGLYRLLQTVKKIRMTAAQKRSLALLLQGMERSGVGLPEAKKKRLKAINHALAALEHRFMDNVTEDRKHFFRQIEDKTLLGGMPQQEKDAARREAQSRALPGWVFTLSPPSYTAVMRYCPDREVRRAFFLANGTVATKGKRDNRPLIVKILRLRHEKARILGFKSFADYILDERMAKTPTRARALLEQYAAHCKQKAKDEVRQLRKFSGIREFQWWDLGFVARTLRQELFDLDEDALKQYFPLQPVMEGMLRIAERLFGLEFVPIRSQKKALIVYEVRRKGRRIGYFFQDLFARPQKRSGAWSSSLRDTVVRPGHAEDAVVLNAANFPSPHGTDDVLLRHVEVQTLFHEFGHALHGLLCEVPYRNLHSYRTEWDFIELPSQLLENWCWHPRSLRRVARHIRTGKAVPSSLLTKLERSRTFLQAIGGLTQAEYAMLDLHLHTRPPPRSVRELDAFALSVERRYSPLPVPEEVKRHAEFHHLFGGGYAAGYYSYLWAEVLEADVFGLFEQGGVLSARLGDKLRRDILAAGTMRPGLDSFRAFMGRDPDVRSLLRKQGLE